MRVTRLESFLEAHGIKPAQLAREAGVSRAYLVRLRFGRCEATRPKMLAIRDAFSRLLGRQVHLAEVFDLGDSVTVVARWQGDRFAEEWYRGDITNACDDTGIMKWPDADLPIDEVSEEQERFHDVTDEICARVFDLVKEAISGAFVSVANDVLARERSR